MHPLPSTGKGPFEVFAGPGFPEAKAWKTGAPAAAGLQFLICEVLFSDANHHSESPKGLGQVQALTGLTLVQRIPSFSAKASECRRWNLNFGSHGAEVWAARSQERSRDGLMSWAWCGAGSQAAPSQWIAFQAYKLMQDVGCLRWPAQFDSV